MKKTFILVASLMISLASFAQKDEIKAAENAMKTGNFKDAVSTLKGAEPLLAAAKDKQKAQYYLVLGKAYNGSGQSDEAAKCFNSVLDLEKNTSKTYSEEAGTQLNVIIKKIEDKAQADFKEGVAKIEDKDYHDITMEKLGSAAAGFEKLYEYSKDTATLKNAAYVFHFAEKYEKSNELYQRLLDMKYRGVSTKYFLTDKTTGAREEVGSKDQMNMYMKSGQYKNPETVVSEPQTIEMKKFMVKNYLALKQNEKALSAIQEAKSFAPNDYGLLVDEANVYYAMGDNVKFKEKLEEAVKINPTDYVLHYNIGVMKADLKDLDGAIASYQKAIEIKPDYADAYNNIGAAVLDKAKPIVEEMNANWNNNKKYYELQAKQLEFYKEALPYFEKAYSFDKNNINVLQNLINIYEQLEMFDQSKEVRDQLKKLTQQ